MSTSNWVVPATEATPVTTLPNRSAGRYLREILLAVEGPTEEVRPSEIADRLGVAPASVTEMTQRLAAEGYVDHEPYGGISLSPSGAALARHLQWRQCVLSRYFVSELDVEIPEQASVQASFELPLEAIRRLRDAVGLVCRDRCDDRVWSGECSGSPRRESMGPSTAD